MGRGWKRAGKPAPRQSFTRQYGGLKLEQARKLKQLQKENSQLRRAVADLTLEKQLLKDIAQGNW